MKPNVLLLMTDQQRYDAMSAHGGAVQTTALDQMWHKRHVAQYDRWRNWDRCPSPHATVGCRDLRLPVPGTCRERFRGALYSP